MTATRSKTLRWFGLGSWVYVSGPISSDPLIGARLAILAGERLRRAGFIPIVPHLSVLWQMIAPVPYEEWIAIDLAVLTRCDVLLRLHGHSPGAEREVAHAELNGIPVVYDEMEILLPPNRDHE